MKKRLDDDSLLSLVLAGVPQVQIAKEYGITVSAVCRRIHEPDFQLRLSHHRKAVLDSVMSKLTTSADEAVDVLSELLHSRNQYLRFSSASRILSLVQDLSVQRDLLDQIEQLKEEQESTISTGGALI